MPLLEDAAALFLEVATSEEYVPFFTTVAYPQHIAHPMSEQALSLPGTQRTG
jgi:hypothetical protein